jgi:hypothetical protein
MTEVYVKGQWERLKYFPDFCQGPRPMSVFMPAPIARQIGIARCCFRPLAVCFSTQGKACSVKSQVFRNFQRSANEHTKREAAAELCRDEAFKRRKAATEHLYCKLYMEGKVCDMRVATSAGACMLSPAAHPTHAVPPQTRRLPRPPQGPDLHRHNHLRICKRGRLGVQALTLPLQRPR